MDVYGVSAPDLFRIDDLLDFSNDEIFSSSGSSSTTTATADSHHHHHHHHSGNSSAAPSYYNALLPNCSADFTDNLCVPSDDVAELEWLSNFVEDSFSDFPNNAFTGTMNINSNTSSFHGRSRSKRSRSISTNTSWNCSLQQPQQHELQNPNSNSIVVKKEENNYSSSSQMEDVPRRCTHCASEKTPQWRTGPMGPKTLCNACGVRYKSGRLVPEYRPAASPTFVLTQHSNSHRKVMELRRQKEVGRGQQSPPQTEEDGMYGRHFQVC